MVSYNNIYNLFRLDTGFRKAMPPSQRAFKVIFYLFCFIFSRSTSQQCPNKCNCFPSSTGLIVSCGSGHGSFPNNVPSTTGIFSLGTASSPQSAPSNNIPSLMQSNFNSCPGLIRVQIVQSNVKSISPGTFSILSKLVKLDLKRNSITHLSRSMLSGLTRLEHLVLSYNTGCQLDQDVFDDVTNLKTLELGGLKLASLGNFFDKLNSLRNLDLHSNNLVRLEYSSFTNLNNLKHLDVSFNDLFGVQKGLRTILSNLSSFKLEYNPWRCNCALTWLKSLPATFVAPSRAGSGLICDQPAKLSFRDIISVADKDMACVPAHILSCNFQSPVLEGQPLDITCDVVGDPYPDVIWSRPDGTNVSAILMTSTKGTVNFSISASTHARHDGKWLVMAENYDGSDIRIIDITIGTTTTITTSTKLTSTTSAFPKSPANSITNTNSPNQGTFSNYRSTLNQGHANIRTLPSLPIKTTLNTIAITGSTPKQSNSTRSISSSSSTIDNVYIIIIVASCLSSGIFLIGSCIFAVTVYKSKRKVRIAAKRRSVYSKQDDFELTSTPVPPTPFQETIHFNE